MKRSSSSKLKGVSWAPESNLRQVKMFFPEDFPTKVGENQDHLQLQPKTFSKGTSANEYNYDLPPGFEGYVSRNQQKAQLPNNPQIKWECPPSFPLSPNWRVAAGEESTEKNDEKLRELRELEAIYPRISAIPLGPFISFDEEKECYDDSDTPLISLIPIEEQELVEDVVVTKDAYSPPKILQSENLKQYNPPATSLVDSQYSGKPITVASSSEADLVAASAAVVAAIIKSNEYGSNIDLNLLIEIINDPIIVGKLVDQHRTATTTAVSNAVSVTTTSHSKVADVPFETALTATMGLFPVSVSETSQETPSILMFTNTPQKPEIPCVYSLSNNSPSHLATTHSVTKSYAVLPYLNTDTPQQREKREAPLDSNSFSEMNSATTMHAVTTQVQSSAGLVSSKPVKDVNYYKNLVRPRGNHKQEDMQSRKNFRELKRPLNRVIKIQKPCIYFNSSRGCRNGSNCPYSHDDRSVRRESGNVPMTPKAKRLKVGREIPWRM